MARPKRNKMKVEIACIEREGWKQVMRKLFNLAEETTEALLNAGFRKTLKTYVLHRLEHLFQGGGIPWKDPSIPVILKNCHVEHMMISTGKNVVKQASRRDSRRSDTVVNHVAVRLSELGLDPPVQMEKLTDELKYLSKSLKSTIADQRASENMESGTEFPSSVASNLFQSGVAATDGPASDSTSEQHFQCELNAYLFTEGGQLIQLNDGGLEFDSDGYITNYNLNGNGDDIDIDAIDDGGKISSGQATGAVNHQMGFTSDVATKVSALGKNICDTVEYVEDRIQQEIFDREGFEQEIFDQERFESEVVARSDPPAAQPVDASEITESGLMDKMGAVYISIDRSAPVSGGDSCSFEDLNRTDCDVDGEVGTEGDDYNEEKRKQEVGTEADDKNEAKREQEVGTEADDFEDGCHVSGAKNNKGDWKQEWKMGKEDKNKWREWKERKNNKGEERWIPEQIPKSSENAVRRR